MNEKILVVEDTVADVIFLKKTLEQEHYAIDYAENGKDALLKLEQDTFDLVILDIVLPDIDGFEVCRRIRSNDRFSGLPILFYSAIKTIDDKLLGLEMGASDFLPKSTDERELHVRIRNLLKLKHKIDARLNAAFFDPVTNAFSIEYFRQRLQIECVRSRRYKRDFSCLMIDVDNFKMINNTFGRHTGDRMLKKIAEVINQNLRSADELCRYKEDTFTAILPETNLRGAYALGEKVRQYMALSDVLRSECTVDLTVSCGVSSYTPEVKDMNHLVEQANLALQQAKQEGRNQTRFFQ